MSSVTVTVLPWIATVALPVPVTRLVGTGRAAAANVGALPLLLEPPEPSATTTPAAAPISTSSASAAHP